MEEEMTSAKWYRSWPVIGAAGVVAPPLGWLLLAAKPAVRWWWKALALIPVVLLLAAHLYLVWGYRPVFLGGGYPTLARTDWDRHYQRIEQDRAEEPVAADTTALAAVEPEQPSAQPGSSPAATAPAATSAAAEPERKQDSYVWSDYRGPRRDGHYTEMPILTDWPETGLPEVWRKPVGGGYASMVVAGGRVFTIEQRRNEEVAAAYDLKTGNQIWQNAWKGHFQESMGGPGPRATPTWHEGRLYALGAEGELRCLDAGSGEVVWAKNILRENGASNLTWGMAASPLVVEDKVIVLPGGHGGKSVVAYHKDTGTQIWSALSDKAAYAAPQLASLAGQRQILIFTADRFAGLSLADGKVLWEYPWKTSYDVNSAQPIVLDDSRVVISSGYDHGAAMLEVQRTGDRFSVKEIWQNRNMKNKFNSSVLHEGYIYGIDDGIMACVDARTGERKWKGGRYGFGQVLLASGHLIVTTESGEVVLIKASPERLQEVDRFPALDGKTWNVPALAHGYLLVRNETEMACFRIGKQGTAAD